MFIHAAIVGENNGNEIKQVKRAQMASNYELCFVLDFICRMQQFECWISKVNSIDGKCYSRPSTATLCFQCQRIELQCVLIG